MIRDGLYKIVYRAPSQPERECEEALAVVRRGRIFASDKYGGVYRGARFADTASLYCKVNLTGLVPAGGELVTGLKGGRRGVTAVISADIDPAVDQQRTVVDIAGAPLEIDIAYLGPLPKASRRAITAR